MLATPEITRQETVTNLTSKITEISPIAKEITVAAENIGAGQWSEMLARTKADGKERGLIIHRSLLSRTKFIPSKISIGTGINKGKAHVAPQFEDIGVKGLILPVVAKVHTHPRASEVAHLKTLIPEDGDLQLFFNDSYSAMVTLDDGGAHLLVRTGESIQQELPPQGIIANLIDEEAAKGGTVADVQKRLNVKLSEYGIKYFYTEQLEPSADGTVTFRAP